MIVEFCIAVRIPRAVADALNVSDGRRAEIKVENGALAQMTPRSGSGPGSSRTLLIVLQQYEYGPCDH